MNWKDKAECIGLPDEWFFPPQGTRDNDPMIARAKNACAVCVVRDNCAEEGRQCFYGVWGGTTPTERGFGSWGRGRGRPRSPFSAEQKEKVLEMAAETTVNQACKDFGISTTTFYNWRRET